MKSKIAIAAFAVFLSACAKPEAVYHTVYQDVLVPVRCEVAAPIRPGPAENAALMVMDLVAYAQELEMALNACRGD